MSLRPLIAIFGTTGVGKSNLAIQLALQIAAQKSRWKGARIINADAMQVYAGLDVITNKVPEAERHGVEHLLMGFKQPGEQYVVGQWVRDAICAIEETHMREQIPIVVGGTSYWMQHLMFPDRLAGMQPEAAPTLSESIARSLASMPPHLLDLFNSLPEQPPDAAVDPDAATALHLLLHHLDPAVAARWHWRDTRKVIRSLRIVKDTGRRPSEIMSEQSETLPKPRYRTLCLWLYAEPSVLNPRLDSRVDAMMERGLLDEVRSLHSLAQQPTSDIDYTLGIYQSIGYKEFHGYLMAPSRTEKAFNEAVDNMKLSTRQYAKRQISWIRNKLLPAINTANIEDKIMPTYLLDATDTGDKWISNVQDPALQLTRDFLNSDDLPDPLKLSENARKMLNINDKPVDPTAVLKAQRKVVCSICTVDPAQPFMVDEGRLAVHLESRPHKRLANKKTPEQYREENRLKKLGLASKAMAEPNSNVDRDSGSLFSS
ncbi:tRNA dimethylallyltransferase, mitochondrial [Mycena sanguinolenta]|uniref:tRNA dimethylallyltransferase, mitochondrial n=1 Tax=Mycena sanguinolenta TaxID=230812 RepID=A0A8H6YE45_9AGAR|nr:tRNA dimethylallyltransferase, mitochondrial [Mycena sanguinolenta]